MRLLPLYFCLASIGFFACRNAPEENKLLKKTLVLFNDELSAKHTGLMRSIEKRVERDIRYLFVIKKSVKVDSLVKKSISRLDSLKGSSDEKAIDSAEGIIMDFINRLPEKVDFKTEREELILPQNQGVLAEYSRNIIMRYAIMVQEKLTFYFGIRCYDQYSLDASFLVKDPSADRLIFNWDAWRMKIEIDSVWLNEKNIGKLPTVETIPAKAIMRFDKTLSPGNYRALGTMTIRQVCF